MLLQEQKHFVILRRKRKHQK